MSSLETSMIKARGAEKRGDFAEAERLYGAVLQKFPGNARARKGMDELFRARAQAMAKTDAPPQAALDALVESYQQRLMPDVVSQAEALLEQYPRAMIVHNLLGAAFLSMGEYAPAERALREAHARGVRHPAICNNLGMALVNLDRHEEAIAFYREAIALDPSHAIARNNLGNALKKCGEVGDAFDAYNEAIALQPDYADAWNNLALVLEILKRVDEAKDAYRKVLALKPDHVGACNNLGNLYAELGDLGSALAFYEKALAIDPDYPNAHFNLGNLYKKQGKLIEANAAYERAKAGRLNFTDACIEQGKALVLEGKLDAALAAFDEALTMDPGHAGALTHKLYYGAHVCDWSAFEGWQKLDHMADDAIPPFAALTFEDDPAVQLRRSFAWAARTFGQKSGAKPLAMLPPPLAKDGRIRIGYFSADFHDHATLYLMSGLLREHDRSRFEIHAFSYGPRRDDAMRRQMMAHVDSFTDVCEMPDADLVKLARGRGLDIAVDLKGYTQDGRTQIFARRLAPVQISYLGYPGTSGADFIDYLVGDRVLIPASEESGYSEKLMLLPDSYQPNDNQRTIAETTLTRADHGLPDMAFVFCCFNQSYKISPHEFAIWMRLLDRVEGSVLWLLKSNDWAETALRAEATRHGIAPERLVFAAKLPHAEHLARHRHADLFLDCFNFNAHTTASDALWGGLPVVTLAGRQFSARVAASLLHAVGLSDMITDTPEAYEALILELAAQPGKLADVKARLAANRLTAPLFDTVRYTRKLEQGFAEAHRRRVAGQPLAEIIVSQD
jgi:predicted O-linked N-acetylglucosamine transferase (SPINDLY family)